MPKDYMIEIKIKNNWLLTRMKAVGLPTAAMLSRASGVGQTVIGSYLNLSRPAIDAKSGKLRLTVLKLSKTLKCLPEDMFPPQHIEGVLHKNKAEVLADAEDIKELIAPPQHQLPDSGIRRTEFLQEIESLLGRLNPRQRHVIESRFGLNGNDPMTLDELGKQLNITQERTRQIELKALRKLIHPANKKRKRYLLLDAVDLSAS